MCKCKVVIIGFGNIGIDLMIKILCYGQYLEMVVMVGIDLQLDGLVCVWCLGVVIIYEGVGGLMQMVEFVDIDFVFDVISVGVYIKNDVVLCEVKLGICVIDLMLVVIGLYCVLVVNFVDNFYQGNVNMVICGG